MHGIITYYNIKKQFGFINGADYNDYFFHISNVKNITDIKVIDPTIAIKEDFIYFEPQKKPKGLVATQITSNPSLLNDRKDKLLTIKDYRIRASDIKEYNRRRVVLDGRYDEYDSIPDKIVYVIDITKYSDYNIVQVVFDSSDEEWINLDNCNQCLSYLDNELI